MRGFAVGCLVLSACFSPQFPSNLECSPSGACPPGQSCHAESQVCVVSLPGPEVDGSVPLDDAGDPILFDGAPGEVDAAPPDCDGGGACELVPSNGALRSDLDGADALLTATAGQSLTFSDDGRVTLSGGVLRGPGEGLIAGVGFHVRDGIAIFAFDGLTIAAGATVRSPGDLPILLLVEGEVTIAGEVDLSAGSGGTPGPGGGQGGGAMTDGAGCGGGRGAVYLGGGGGGFATQGGEGGGAGAASAGAACTGVPATLVPLRGGSGGGGGGGSADGGGGGGAIQITSLSSIHIAGGWIHASGGGGQGFGACAAPSRCTAAAGGGSGGAILLEAPTITLDSGTRLVAVGGGGGGGSGWDDMAGGYTSGLSAVVSETGATPAGASGHAAGGRGGDGGHATIPPGTGGIGNQMLGPTEDGHGGGGGSAGRIRLNALTLNNSAQLISPPPSIGAPAQR